MPGFAGCLLEPGTSHLERLRHGARANTGTSPASGVRGQTGGEVATQRCRGRRWRQVWRRPFVERDFVARQPEVLG